VLSRYHLLVVIVAVAASSCGADRSSDATELDFSGKALPAADSQYPVAYGYSRIAQLIEGDGDNRWQRELVIGKATADCMHRAGYDYPDIRWTKDQIVSDWIRPRHVPLSIDDARTVGYGPAPTFSGPPATDRVNLEGEAMAKYQDWELQCVVEGLDVAFADFETYEANRESLETAVTEFETAFSAANETHDLNASWADCMSDRGYSYPSPEEARAAAWGTTADAARAIAVVDAECRSVTDYDSQWWELYSSAEAAFMLEHEELVVTVFQSGRVVATGSGQ